MKYTIRIPVCISATYETTIDGDLDKDDAIDIAMEYANSHTPLEHGRFLNQDNIMIHPHLRDVVVSDETDLITTYDNDNTLI